MKHAGALKPAVEPKIMTSITEWLKSYVHSKFKTSFTPDLNTIAVSVLWRKLLVALQSYDYHYDI